MIAITTKNSGAKAVQRLMNQNAFKMNIKVSMFLYLLLRGCRKCEKRKSPLNIRTPAYSIIRVLL